MTVGELKKILETIPDSLLVVVSGYETGADDFDLVLERVKRDLSRPSYNGTYEIGQGVEAVIIDRVHHKEQGA